MHTLIIALSHTKDTQNSLISSVNELLYSTRSEFRINFILQLNFPEQTYSKSHIFLILFIIHFKCNYSHQMHLDLQIALLFCKRNVQ